MNQWITVFFTILAKKKEEFLILVQLQLKSSLSYLHFKVKYHIDRYY